MKKIYIDKADTVAVIVEKIVSLEDGEIILYIPRFTKIAETANNFRLLKREIDSAEKVVEIESVDDEVLEMAQAAGINSRNPFFQKNKKSFSDIVSPANEHHNTSGIRMHRHKEIKPEVEADIMEPVSREVEFDEEDVVETSSAHKKPIHSRISRLTKRIKFKLRGSDDERVDEGEVDEQSPAFSPKWIIGGVLAAVVVGFVATMLGSAKIVVSLDKVSWNFNGTIYASTVIKDPYFANGQARIAGAVFEKSKNVSGTFAATGTEDVSRKASGKITIYNAYSTTSQALIKDTRFATPDGKIYRIQQAVTVPGAKLVNNKIVPATIEVTVYADKPGSDYNIEASTFRIPGFQGTPKYEGFYAQSEAAMSGGLVGVGRVATSIDVSKAKDQNRKNLENGLKAELMLGVPQEIKVLSGASSFTVTKETVSSDVDASGNFTVTTTGNLKIFGFKESDVTKAMKSALVGQTSLDGLTGFNTESASDVSNDDLVLKAGVPKYGNPQVDFNNKNMTLSVSNDSVWTHAFDVDAFKKAALGRSPEALNDEIKDLSGVKSINVSLWPFWVMRVPSNPDKVTIDVR